MKRRHGWAVVLALLLPAGAAYRLLYSQELAFYHLLLAAVLAALLLVLAVPGVRWRRAALAAAGLGAAWCGAEIAMDRAPDRLRTVYHDSPGGYRLPDVPGIGYAARPGSWRNHQVWVGTQRLYDVTYHMDAWGWRVGPGPAPSHAPRAAVFLGCSFTLGVGLADDETLPALIEGQSGGAIACYNFGMDGYGPHQALALLERDLVRPVVGRHDRVTGILIAIPHHALRAAGAARWGFRGPRYVAQPDGQVRCAGPFHSRAVAAACNLAARSYVLSALHERWRTVTTRDLNLQAAVVARVAEEFRRQFGGPLVVLAWDTGDAVYPDMVNRLRGRGLTVFEVSALVPGYSPQDPALMRPGDSHPTPACIQQLAERMAALRVPPFD